MRKRIVALAICVCLVLSACNNKPATGTPEIPTGQATEAPTEALPTVAPTKEPAAEPTLAPTQEPTPEPTAEPTAEPTQIPESETEKTVTVEPLTILTHTENSAKYTDDFNCKGYVECDVIALPAYFESIYPELAASFKDYSESRKILMQGTLERLSETYDELLAAGDEYGLNELMSSEHIVVKRADDNLVSFDNSFSEYNGGVHGYYGVIGYTFDTRTGKQLGIKDIVKDTDAFAELAAQQLEEERGEEIMLVLVPDNDLPAYIKEQIEIGALNFTVSNFGVKISFNPYEIGSYAAGIISTTVNFNANKELFYEKYLSVADKYVQNADANLCFESDFDMDGKTEVLCVYGTEMDKYGEYAGIAVRFEGSDEIHRIDAYGWGLNAYLMHTEHGNFLYVESTGDSDFTETHIFKIENAGKISYLGSTDMSVAMVTVHLFDPEYDIDYEYYSMATFNPENFEMDGRYDMIGTNFYTAHFKVGEDGMPKLLDEYYSFTYPFELTSLVNLELEEISTETFMPGATIVVPAGSVYHMIYTDGKNTVILELEDGRGVVMELDVENHFGYYKDTPLDEIFDGINYAG